MQAPFGLLSEFVRHTVCACLCHPPCMRCCFPNKVRPTTCVWHPSARIVGSGWPATLPDRELHSSSSSCAHSQNCTQSPACEKAQGTPSFLETPSRTDAVPCRPESGLESLLFIIEWQRENQVGFKEIQTRRPRSLQQAKGGPRNICLGRNAVKKKHQKRSPIIIFG